MPAAAFSLIPRRLLSNFRQETSLVTGQSALSELQFGIGRRTEAMQIVADERLKLPRPLQKLLATPRSQARMLQSEGKKLAGPFSTRYFLVRACKGIPRYGKADGDGIDRYWSTIN